MTRTTPSEPSRAATTAGPSEGVRDALIEANPTWHRNYDEDGDPYISMHTDAEAVDIILGVLSDRPDLLIRLAVESGAVSHVEGGKELLDPDGEWAHCTWLAVATPLVPEQSDDGPGPAVAPDADGLSSA